MNPCPECGGPARPDNAVFGGRIFFVVTCRACMIQSVGATADEAIEKWNSAIYSRKGSK